MPRKSVQKQQEESKQTTTPPSTPQQVAAVAAVVEQEPKATKKRNKTVSTNVASVNPTAAVSETTATTAVDPDAVSECTADTTTESKSRRFPTRESVESEFDSLVASIDEEINKLRANASAKAKGVRFLRTVNKRIKTLRTHALRVSKQKSTTRRNNTNSGFLKPVQISKDLAKFTGWDQNQLRSRVEVTKFICEYIKQHNLQDPEDKRKIRIENDQNLKKLLKFDAKDGKPLTYYSLQTYLKSHFTSVQTTNTTTVSTRS